MERHITGFHQDDEGDWVAELDCGHHQHVRHKPPFFERPWAVTSEGRASMMGKPLSCALCDRMELPEHFVLHRHSPLFDQDTVPPALLKAHQLKAGVWARIHVMEGSLRYHLDTPSPRTFLVDAEHPGIVVPEVPHHVEPVGNVQFYLAIYSRVNTD